MTFVPVEYFERWEGTMVADMHVLRCTLKALGGDWQMGCREVVREQDTRRATLRLQHYVTRWCRHQIFDQLEGAYPSMQRKLGVV